ncbi:MAG TPA: TetR family transcriptional regulator [Burkholderiaceae bacterium]
MDPVARNILDAAIAEFSELGLAGARVEAIAARTGTSKGMLYYHFGSKEGLYTAALAESYARARASLVAPDYDAMAPMDALRAYVGHLFDLHVKSPQFVRMVMGENLLRGRFIAQAESVREASGRSLDALAAILRRGQANGLMREELQPLDVYANVVGMCFHFVSNRPTFSALFEQGVEQEAVTARRRRVIVDAIECQAKV